MPSRFADSATGANRSKLSAIEQLVLRWENVSEAAAKIAISLAPASRAASKPRMFGTSTGYRTPGMRLMLFKTSALSAICGTHFAETNAPASTTLNPASASRSMRPILIAAGTAVASFCSPSRGPTSTMRTSAGRRIGSLLAVGGKRDQRRALLDEIPGCEMHAVDDPVCGRHDRMLHLHGLEHKERLAAPHPLTRPRRHLDDLARHRRREPPARGVELRLRLERIDEAQAMFDPLELDHSGIAGREQSRAVHHAIKGHDEVAAVFAMCHRVDDIVPDLESVAASAVVHADGALTGAVVPAQVLISGAIEAPAVTGLPGRVRIARSCSDVP